MGAVAGGCKVNPFSSSRVSYLTVLCVAFEKIKLIYQRVF